MRMQWLVSLLVGAALVLGASMASAQQPAAAPPPPPPYGPPITLEQAKATKAFDDALAQGGNNLRILRLPGASPVEGGIPIVVDGKLIGAVGVSGVLSSQDAQVARAVVDSLK